MESQVIFEKSIQTADVPPCKHGLCLVWKYHLDYKKFNIYCHVNGFHLVSLRFLLTARNGPEVTTRVIK